MRYIDSDEYDGRYENDHDYDVDTVPCPYCGDDIYDDAEVCPHCGSYIIPDEKSTGRPVWIVWTALILLALILMGYTCFLRYPTW